ncbi:MAG: N-acetylmuramoyl-L-alanine amidase [Elusimicrobiota bacterium]
MNLLLLLFCAAASAQTPPPAVSTATAAETAAGSPAPKKPAVRRRAGAKAVSAQKPAAKEPSRPTGPSVMVVYPPEGQVLDGVRAAFILGAVNAPERPFRVNGVAVKPHPKGGFLAYVPVEPGVFTFRCELDLPGGTTTWTRTVQVRTPAPLPPVDPPAILPETVEPSEDVELRPGDWLTVRMRGSPGLLASYTIHGVAGALPMAESRPGVYEGAWQVRAGDRFQESEVVITLKGTAKSPARATARGRLTVAHQPPGVVAVRSEGIVNVRGAPGQGYILFPPTGTRFLATGRSGRELRVRLSEGLSGWIDERAFEWLPPGTPPPQAVLGDVSLAGGEDSATVVLDLSQKVPFQVDEDPGLSEIRLRLYSTVPHVNWLAYREDDAFVRSVDWTQPENDVVELRVRLGERVWGYDASWKSGQLRLELRRAPRIAPAPSSVFKGRVIALDPGHGPSAPGAVGPRGTWEQDANMRLARDVQALLALEGAQAFLTRGTEDDDVPLGERTRRAWARRADLLLSIHNNALADGDDPFARPHGSAVFFYHPHSQALAAAVYGAYRRLGPLPGEGLRYGNLFVARAPQMPSVLTESAYLMFPAQEELLLDAASRRKFAAAMVEGLRSFLEAERRRQGPAGATPARAPQTKKPRREAR